MINIKMLEFVDTGRRCHLSHGACKLLCFLLCALEMSLVGGMIHDQQGGTTRTAFFRRNVKHCVIVGHLLNPQNEKRVGVAKYLDMKFAVGCHNYLPRPSGVNNVADVNLDKTRLVSVGSVSLDNKETV